MVSNKNNEEILKHINRLDYVKGQKLFPDCIEHMQTTENSDFKSFLFLVESESYYAYYDCRIEITNKNKISYLHCTCPQFKKAKSCKHLATCLINYEEDIFDNTPITASTITEYIFQVLTKQPNKIKKEVKLEFAGETNTEDETTLKLKIKIGTEKMYVLTPYKLTEILDSLKEKTPYTMSKNFMFDPEIHYINESNLKILEFLENRTSYSSPYNFYYSNRPKREFIYSNYETKDLLLLLKDVNFILNDYKIKEYTNEFPFVINLKTKDDNYDLDFEFLNKCTALTHDNSYIQKNYTIYKVSNKMADLLSLLKGNNLFHLEFKKDKLEEFSNSLLPIIKNNVEVAKNITEIIIDKKPCVKLYFDLYHNKIVCNIKLIYSTVEIDYFDRETNILRDIEYEDVIITDLLEHNFVIEEKKIIINDIDDMGEFIEEGLLEISNKYETFTSKKIKDINVIKNSKVTSTFSIGQDNIMSYNFDFGVVTNDEIEKVLTALRNKKKYFRLKGGELINLKNSNDLKELDSLIKDIDLKDKNLFNSGGTIPKYQAIYLDSLKKSKYKIIKTDNLFDSLIEKFNSYKECNINFSKKDLSILRDYQLTGVKWLYTIHKTGFGGILADEMGLGKSIQTIYFIKQMLKEKPESKFLIVVPTSLAYNWDREFKKFGNEVKFKVLVGQRENRRLEIKKSDDCSVLITTYGTLREDKQYYEEILFTSIIIDEAQNIKNPNTEVTKTVKQLKSESMFALTGTPIENSIIELWSIFDFIMPGFLASLVKFKTKYNIKNFDENTENLLKGLNKQISPFILRRRKKDVLKELPEKIENNIFIELSDAQKKIYVAELERVNKEIEKAMDEGGMSKVKFLILQLLTKLRQICIDPKIVFENYTDKSNKIDTLIKVLNEVVENNHKVLIFTSFRSALEIVKEELEKNNITSYTIDGSVSSAKRLELVEKFNNDNTNVFLIMLKAGGTGLNLTSADIVIHLDLWWNPQAENQATDRAHRIGQKNSVEVIKLISKGTIEEKILNLQEKKKMLSDKIIDSTNKDSNILSSLSEKDLRKLLSYGNDAD